MGVIIKFSMDYGNQSGGVTNVQTADLGDVPTLSMALQNAEISQTGFNYNTVTVNFMTIVNGICGIENGQHGNWEVKSGGHPNNGDVNQKIYTNTTFKYTFAAPEPASK